METYIMWMSDSLDTKLKGIFLSGNAAELGVLNQKIQHGNSFFRGWVENSTGRTLLLNGFTGAAVVPDSALNQLANIQTQIGQIWGDTLSIGVGMAIKEAKRAMEVAHERGGGRILFYTTDLDRPTETPLTGIAKAEEVSAHSQFMEAQPPEQPAPAAPAAQPDQQQEAPVQGPDDIKQVVLKILQQIKSQKEGLDQLQQAAPDVYKAVLGAIQAMIVMARQMADGGGGGGEAPAPQDMSATQQAHETQDLQEQAVQNERELAVGMQEEMQEHGIPEAQAMKLAQDHIAQDPQYYTRKQGM